ATRASRAFQGHTLTSLQATTHNITRRYPAGSYLVKTAQPLGSFAVFLLEPTSADGLATWNFFDDGIKVGQDFPIARLEMPAPITTIAAADLPEDVKPKQPVTFELVYESDH